MNYTSIEQSRKLLELGLDPKTSDCNWQHAPGYENDEGKITGFWNDPEWGQSGDSKDLPCWSLGALLELMPPYLFEFERGIDLNIYRNLNGKGWHVSYMPNNTESLLKDRFRQINNGKTPIEAAYNMVVWLLENGYIKAEKK